MADAGPLTATFSLAPRGYATSFPDQDMPQEYCAQFLNLFTNSVGNSEKRQGIEEFLGRISTRITVTNYHELINLEGEILLMASGGGQIWLLDESGVDAHSLVFTFETTSAKIFSFYSAKRLIFYNGVDRCVYTQDGANFFELLSILEVGTAVSASGVSAPNVANRLEDANIASWLGTDVTERDLIYYTEVCAYGLVQQVVTAHVSHTAVSAAAGGVGAGATPASGARYAVIDTIELNIIPVSGLGFATDNTGTLASGSNTLTVRIEAVEDFSITEVRKGDFVYNETRQQVTQVSQVTTSSLAVAPAITGQTVGDLVHLLKSSAPIVKYGVSHFQRAYAIDARDDQKMRISGIGDPEDWGSINAGTYDISTQQPASERFRQLTSFQRFLVVGGTRNLFAFQGTDPIGVIDPDTGQYLLAPDWTDLGLFPTGTLSRTGMVNVGNDLMWVSNNGVRQATLSKTTSQLTESQSSLQLDKTLRELLKRLGEDEIIAYHYPRRSWVLFKAGDEMFVYNLARIGGAGERTTVGGQEVAQQLPPAWHLFDGPFAQQKCFFIRENGDLITGGVNGQLNIFEQGAYSDLGQPIRTIYESAWHGFEKRQQKSIARKHGKFIKPVWESVEGMAMNIAVVAPYARESSDEVRVSSATTNAVIGSAIIGTWVIGGNDVTFDKYPLRWHGEVAKFEFETESVLGPYTLSSYGVFYSQFGAK